MFLWLKMFAAQRVLGVAKDRQRQEHPFAHVGEERLKIRKMLEHIPQRDRIERNQIRIDQQRALLEPGDAGRVDIVAVGRAPAVAPHFDERTRADTDIDQRPTIMLLDEIEPCPHQCPAEIGAGVAIEAVEIILIVGCEPGVDRIEADAELRPPRQAAARVLLNQR